MAIGMLSEMSIRQGFKPGFSANPIKVIARAVTFTIYRFVLVASLRESFWQMLRGMAIKL